MASQFSKAYNGPFRIFRDIHPLRDYRRDLLLAQRSVGLVPTMGALHAGHLSLIREAARHNTDIFVSIYVNPTQFGANEDLDSYPKTWDADLNRLKRLDDELASQRNDQKSDSKAFGRISAVFAPSTKTMYPTLPPNSDAAAQGSFVTITPLASVLEGASRPTFFRGVATICTKLFNITTPDRVYLGQKDVQQTIVIKRMVKDFCMGIDVVIVPTERESDGLALSSRNVYLGQRRRRVATVLSKALKLAEAQYAKGSRERNEILGPAMELASSEAQHQQGLDPTERARFEVDYISLSDPESLRELDEVQDDIGAVLSGAIKMLPVEEAQAGEDHGLGDGGASVRLIDNIILRPATTPVALGM